MMIKNFTYLKTNASIDATDQWRDFTDEKWRESKENYKIDKCDFIDTDRNIKDQLYSTAVQEEKQAWQW